MELFRIGFLSVTLVDLLDIALVSFIFYRLYLAMQGTIAIQIFAGLVLVLGVLLSRSGARPEGHEFDPPDHHRHLGDCLHHPVPAGAAPAARPCGTQPA